MTLPVLFMAGAVVVFAYAFRDRLLPGVPVEFVTAMAISGGKANGAGSESADAGSPGPMLFQATGWIEPDPLPIRVTPLYSGVVREVHVLEGQAVTNGQALVSLVDEDAKLALRRAEAELAQARAVERSLHARLELARTRQATAARQHESETARLAERADMADRMRSLNAGVLPEQERVQAELREKSQSATVAAAAASIEEAKAEAALANREIEVQRELIAAAEVARDEAGLALARTRVVSPANGVVLRLLATPGKRLMLAMDHPDSATAVILYEPGKLQVRVDAPLADAGKLAVGQRVRLTCSLLPELRFKGVVTRIVGEADMQRNTLQAKVRIVDPDPRLRPEMLCRAEFYGLSSEDRTGVAAVTSGALTVYVPPSAVVDRGEQEAGVWVLSPDDRHAERRGVKIGVEERDGDLPIVEGIRPGDRVIVNPPPTLKDGARVRAREASLKTLSR